MATWDSADLLQRCRDEAQEPTQGTTTTDAQWYSLLTASQHKMYRLFAVHCPAILQATYTLTTANDGFVYTFPDGKYPLGYAELRDGTEGRLLIGGPDWSQTADFVVRGNAIYFPDFQSRTFANTLIAKYIASPGDVSASTQPALVPDWSRILMVYDSVKEWAGQGGLRDPSVWAQKFQHAWAGDPSILGDVGIMGALKTQYRYPGLDGLRRRGLW